MIKKIKKIKLNQFRVKLPFTEFFSSGLRVLKHNEVGVFIFNSEINAPGRLTGFAPKRIFYVIVDIFFKIKNIEKRMKYSCSA